MQKDLMEHTVNSIILYFPDSINLFDVIGSPSAYCEISIIDRNGKTRETKKTCTIKKNSDPIWDARFTLYVFLILNINHHVAELKA